MFNLFLRTVSQGLQAFIPIAVSWTWFRRSDPDMASAIGIGALASIPVTVMASRAFAASDQKALDESILAAAALLVAATFLSIVWGSRPGHPVPARSRNRLASSAAGVATVLIIVRQSMETGATFAAAFFELRSFDATRAVVLGTLLAAMVAAAWVGIGGRVSSSRLSTATRCFAALFVVQVLIYGIHEAAEAGLLPFSEALHAASEPYGPDGVYGLHFSDLLVIVPLAAGALTRASRSRLASVMLPLGLMVGLAMGSNVPVVRAAGESPSTLQKQPHLLFRDTTPGAAFGTLSIAPLAAPDKERASAGLSCERVSFSPLLVVSAGRGICLRAESTFFGLFTGYTAVFVDGSLKDRGAPLKVEGKPSRTRVSSDGKVGAFTVFVFGDGYSSDFSTRTLLVDMASGSPLADLETFAVYRNGEKFSAKDFNFWGVTFARDGDTFYASLRTAGKTYLVRGAIGARAFTVLRENVECPSLSPDGRRLAFKKFVGPDPGAWRIAVLDVATMQERLVAGETRYVDDQMEWLDADRLLYAVPRRTTSSSDVWVVPVDGDAPATVFLPLAESPIVVR